MKVPKFSTVVRPIPLHMILVDPTIQPRVGQSEETIFQYSLSLDRGDGFPPIDVFEDGKKYLLADGGHRLEAYRLEGRDTIPARIHQGGRKEALIFAASANLKNGLCRSNQDKHRAVENVLKDPELGLWSNNQIAEICTVSHPFVGRVRWQLACNGYKFDSVRVSSNGRQIETANIGRKKRFPKPEHRPEETSDSVRKKVSVTKTQAPTGETPEAGNPSEVSPQAVNPETEADPTDASEPGRKTQDGTAESVPEVGGQGQSEASPAEPESGNGPGEEPAQPSGKIPQADEAQQEPVPGSNGASSAVEDDIQTLRAKVAALEKALQSKELELQSKNLRICELEKTVKELEADNAYYIKEIEAYEKEERAREIASKMRTQVGGMPLHG